MNDAILSRRTMSKVSRRLIPIMTLMFCANFLDRVNIGFADLQMNRDLGLMPEVYGFAAGILFVSYSAFVISSNLILDKVGTRVWLARIMIAWGVVAAVNALVWDRHSLYVMRFILGAAEAGFLSSLMAYGVQWFPARERAAAVTLFMIGSPISVIIFGAPLSTAILGLDGARGFAGWQWLLILEGLVSIILGFVAYWWMTDTPERATWLEPAERTWLAETINQERSARS